MDQKTEMMKPKMLNSAEAIYGFVAWLTTRDQKITLSAKNNASQVVELVEVFCKENNLEDVREDWTKNLKHPKQ